MAPSTDCDVLIAGAGPTGLVLALWLTRFGVRVRIVDKTSEPGTTSRALAVQSRTLELYQQMGLAEAVVSRGIQMAAVNLWVAGRKRARAQFGELGTGLSPFPYALIYPQDEHERLLIDRLAAAGVEVERRTELVSFSAYADAVDARLRRADRTEVRVRSAYLAGCDGAHSTVRENIGAGFPGGTYQHIFYVADVAASGPIIDRELNVALDSSDLPAIFPLKDEGHVRLVGTVRDEAAAKHKQLGWDDVSKEIIDRLRIEVRDVRWFSTYHVHHRVAQHFHSGRVFLLGDAAHIHSPVGGQGMNTGIGDAINLAWKMAAVMHRRAPERLLESYSAERRKFACRLVGTTDRAFTFISRSGDLARFVRTRLVPIVFPMLFSWRAARRFMFRTISQIVVNYRGSSLSAGKAGNVGGGDRMPWVAGADNFAPLASLDWQVHVHGSAPEDTVRSCVRRNLALHEFPWTDEAARAGLARDAAYLVRPDGYVGWAGNDSAALDAYLDQRGVMPLAAAIKNIPQDRIRRSA